MKLIFAALFALSFNFQVFANDKVFLAAPITASVTTTSTQYLPVNTLRSYLLIINNGSASIIVKPNAVQSGSEGITIPAGGNWEPPIAPMGSIFIKAASGTQSTTIIEGQ